MAVGLQALGSVATVAVVMLVTHRFGLEAQGRFSLLKSWADTAVALGLLGMPQALLHMAYHGKASLGRLRAYAERYASWVLLLGLAAAALAAFSPLPWTAWCWLAVPGLVLHGLLRSLLLKASGPVGYALATVLPAACLLGAVGALAAVGVPAFGPGLVLASVFAAAGVWWLLSRAGLSREPVAGLRMPLHIHGHAFVQNLAAAAQVAALLGLFSLLGAPAAAVGEASVSLLVLQLFGVAAAYLAPMVYDRAARRPTTRVALAFGPAMLLWPVAAVLGVWALPWALVLAVPQAGSSLQQACQLMALAGVLLLVNRVIATRLQAEGAFPVLTALAMLRLVGSVGALAWAWSAAWVQAFALAVLAGEALVMAATALVLWQRGWRA